MKGSFVKKFFLYFFVINGVIIILCIYKIVPTMRFYKICDYKFTEYKIDGGEIFARLDGTYKNIAKQRTILSKPYSLFVSFDYEHYDVKKINIKEIKLVDADTQEIAFNKIDLAKIVKFTGPENIRNKIFSSGTIIKFEGLDLNYSKYELHITYSAETEDAVIDNEAVLLFEKDYSEYWSSDLLEIPYPIFKIKTKD